MNSSTSVRNPGIARGTFIGLAVAAGLMVFSLHTKAETDREYCERQQGTVRTVCLRELDRAAKSPKAAPSPTVAGAATESDREYCERQQGPAQVVCMRQLEKAAAAPPAAPAQAATAASGPAPVAGKAPSAASDNAKLASGAALYKVVDGYHVDPQTLQGFKTWRAAACDRCHGANQEGLVGPSLVESLKTLSKADFIKTVRDGRLSKGMQSFGNSPVVMNNIDHLYAYLKGRSDGAITKAHVVAIE